MKELYLHGDEEDFFMGELPDIKSCHLFVNEWFDFMHENYGLERAVLYCKDSNPEYGTVTWIFRR